MPNTAIVKLYETTEAKLTDLPVRNGQMIFSRDTHTIYMDLHGNRLAYNDITVLNTDEERLAILAPIAKFYYVRSTHVLWSFEKSGEWWQLTPSNLNPVFFGKAESFPEVGSNDTLYVDDDVIYKWDPVMGGYLAVANMTKWDEIPE